MAGHQTPTQYSDRDPVVSLEKDLLERLKIQVFLEESEPAVGAIEDMIDQTAGSLSGRSGHAAILRATNSQVKARVTFS
jgi:hypothetical protein